MTFQEKSLSRIAAFLLFAASASLHAQVAAPVITDAWVKPTVPGGSVSGGYMSIKSAKPLKLVKAESTAAGLVEIHSMSMKDNVMEMKAIDAIDIPAGKTVELKPGGLHVMLMKITRSINAGDSVPLVLTFEGADKKPLVVKVNATARDRAAPAPAK
ncbi:MAG: copper chaperone PCu(A)C [Betaproteobacteria bacterium]